MSATGLDFQPERTKKPGAIHFTRIITFVVLVACGCVLFTNLMFWLMPDVFALLCSLAIVGAGCILIASKRL